MKNKKQKLLDMTPLYRKFAGHFVALNRSRTKVLGTGRTHREALREAKNHGIEHPTLEWIPWEGKSYLL
ncbi:MAG: hypothetical protein LHV69_05010 [Elusimicrobia bacterium]|nr:hypothetical protein [Candidatus Obscuribacterium magneticum]